MMIKRILLPSILSLISGSVMADAVIPETYINVVYPAFEKDPVHNRYSLMKELRYISRINIKLMRFQRL